MTRQNKPHPRQRGKKAPTSEAPTLWGIHAVASALANPLREAKELSLTPNAAGRIQDILGHPIPKFNQCTPKEIDKKIGPDHVHQGALLITNELPTIDIDQLPGTDRIAVLDQVTDPHNVGAILRSATAFGISALIMTQRNSPPLSGTLAKTASGGLEHVKIIHVGNLAQALTKLGEKGYHRIGFDGMGETTLSDLSFTDKEGIALVLGAEEKGLRRLTRDHCDYLCRIEASGAFCSLNVSNAAAIAFHHFQTPQTP